MPRRSALGAGSFVDWGQIVDLCACAVDVGAATESRVVPRHSALGAGSFVDRGQIVDLFVGAVKVGSATKSVGATTFRFGGGVICGLGVDHCFRESPGWNCY